MRHRISEEAQGESYAEGTKVTEVTSVQNPPGGLCWPQQKPRPSYPRLWSDSKGGYFGGWGRVRGQSGPVPHNTLARTPLTGNNLPWHLWVKTLPRALSGRWGLLPEPPVGSFWIFL